MKTLVVVDMQNDFITGSLGSDYANSCVLPNVLTLIANGDYDRVLFTKDTHFENYLDTLEGKKLPVRHCIKGTDGWRLNPAINGLLRYDEYGHDGIIETTNGNKPFSVVTKNTFGKKNIANCVFGIMKTMDNGERKLVSTNDETSEIVICGLCTDICVVSNALLLRAFYPDTKITCVEKCCGGVTKESHDAAISVMKSCQIDIE